MENPFRNLFNKHENTEYTEGIKEKIETAKEHALAFEVFNELNQKQAAYQMKEIQETASEEELEYIKEIETLLEKSTITTFSRDEFSDILKKFGLNLKIIPEIVEHEAQHIEVAEKLGAINNGYQCIIHEHPTSPTGYALYAAANIDLPKEWDIAKKEEILKQIIKAPEEIGISMSSGDKNLLQLLENK